MEILRQGRLPPGVPSAAQVATAAQANLYLDPVNGSDGRSGISSGSAWKTGSKLAQAIGDAPVNTTLAINLLSDVPIGDRIVVPPVGVDGFLKYIGTATTLRTSTATAGTAGPTNTTQTRAQFIDSSIVSSWSNAGAGSTSLIGKRIRITSGARAGAIGWLIKDAGSKTALTPRMLAVSLTDPIPVQFTAVAQASGDPYVVEDLTSIHEIDFSKPMSTHLGRIVKCAFYGVKFPVGEATPIVPGAYGNPTVAFIGCDLGIVGGVLFSHACVHSYGYLVPGSYALLNGCWIDQYLYYEHGAYVALQQGSVAQAANIIGEGGHLYADDVGIFDCTGHGLETRVGGRVQAPGLIWGNANSGRGIAAGAQSGVAYSTKPSVTGTLGDTIVGGTAKAYASIPYFETANGAGITAG
jgi:hypothetical protein